MGARIMGIDYGKVRTGLSVTDPLQIIVSPLDTIETKNLKPFLKTYLHSEKVEKIVFGKPTHKDGNLTYLWKHIQKEVEFIQKTFPDMKIDYEDESFTSSEAKQIIFQTAKKKKRRDKKTIDKISAVLILQKYLGHI